MLETKIEELTKAITTLTEFLQGQDLKREIAQIETSEKEPEQVKINSKTYTHDDLKALCLSKSREDVANKPKLKSLLKEFGAAKVLDVKSKEDLTTIITRINYLTFNIKSL